MSRTFPKPIMRAAYARSRGRCEAKHDGNCGNAPLHTGKFRYDHVIPYAISRDSSLDNCQVLCLACDAIKTYGTDIPVIAKGTRIRDRHIGIHRSRKPMPHGRHSKTKVTFGRKIIPRLTIAQKHQYLRNRIGFGG